MHRPHPEHDARSSRSPAPSPAHAVASAPPRIALLPFAPDHLLALVEASDHAPDAPPSAPSAPAVAARTPAERFAARFGYPLADGLAELYGSPDVSPAWVERLRAATAADPWEHGFAVLHREHRRVIGTAAFKGPPDLDGVVEIAYAIAPAYERQGYATEAAGALVAYASADRRVCQVRAHTQPHDGPSAGVLRRCGFTWVGAVVDPEDGRVWRWERGSGACRA